MLDGQAELRVVAQAREQVAELAARAALLQHLVRQRLLRRHDCARAAAAAQTRSQRPGPEGGALAVRQSRAAWTTPQALHTAASPADLPSAPQHRAPAPPRNPNPAAAQRHSTRTHGVCGWQRRGMLPGGRGPHRRAWRWSWSPASGTGRPPSARTAPPSGCRCARRPGTGWAPGSARPAPRLARRRAGRQARGALGCDRRTPTELRQGARPARPARPLAHRGLQPGVALWAGRRTRRCARARVGSPAARRAAHAHRKHPRRLRCPPLPLPIKGPRSCTDTSTLLQATNPT